MCILIFMVNKQNGAQKSLITVETVENADPLLERETFSLLCVNTGIQRTVIFTRQGRQSRVFVRHLSIFHGGGRFVTVTHH